MAVAMQLANLPQFPECLVNNLLIRSCKTKWGSSGQGRSALAAGQAGGLADVAIGDPVAELGPGRWHRRRPSGLSARVFGGVTCQAAGMCWAIMAGLKL